MAGFTEYLTVEGELMLAKMAAGTEISFTKVICGDGNLATNQNPKHMTSLINPKMQLDIQMVNVSGGNNVIISAELTNDAIEEGFDFREKGIYMSDGTKEVLGIYGNSGNNAEHIEPMTSSFMRKKIRTFLSFSDKDSINITIKKDTYANAPILPEQDNIEDFLKTQEAEAIVEGDTVIINGVVYTFTGGDNTNINDYATSKHPDIIDTVLALKTNTKKGKVVDALLIKDINNNVEGILEGLKLQESSTSFPDDNTIVTEYADGVKVTNIINDSEGTVTTEYYKNEELIMQTVTTITDDVIATTKQSTASDSEELEVAADTLIVGSVSSQSTSNITVEEIEEVVEKYMTEHPVEGILSDEELGEKINTQVNTYLTENPIDTVYEDSKNIFSADTIYTAPTLTTEFSSDELEIVGNGNRLSIDGQLSLNKNLFFGNFDIKANTIYTIMCKYVSGKHVTSSIEYSALPSLQFNMVAKGQWTPLITNLSLGNSNTFKCTTFTLESDVNATIMCYVQKTIAFNNMVIDVMIAEGEYTSADDMQAYGKVIKSSVVDMLQGQMAANISNVSKSVVDAETEMLKWELENAEKKNTQLSKLNDFTWGNFDKAYFCFVCDDCNSYLPAIYDLFHEKGIPLSSATITSTLGTTYSGETRTIKDILNLIVADGGEILAHYNGNLADEGYSDGTHEFLTDESDWLLKTRDVKKVLEENGFEVRGIIRADYTQENSETGEKICRKYFDYADGLGISTQYNLKRTFFHNYTDLDSLKAKIDTQASTAGFYPYCFHGTETLASIENLTEIIDYILAKGDSVKFSTYANIYDNIGTTILVKKNEINDRISAYLAKNKDDWELLELTYDENPCNLSGASTSGSASTYISASVEAKKGETYVISGRSYYNYPLYIALDAEGNVLSKYPTSSAKETEYNNIVYTCTEDCTIHINRIFAKEVVVKRYTTMLESENPLDDKVILFAGDSITYGQGDSTTSSMSTKGWRRIIATNNPKAITYGYGIGGTTIAKRTDRTDSICERISTMLSAHPEADYVVLEGGINDTWADVTTGTISQGYAEELDETTFCGAFESMLKQALTGWMGKKICYLTTYKVSSSAKLSEYMTLAKQMCEKWSVPYLDLYNQSGICMEITGVLEQYFADNIHINTNGYEKITPMIERFIKSL